MPKKPMDPIDEALAAKEKLAARDSADQQAFQAWKSDPNPQTTQGWLKRLEPIFKSFEQQHRAPRTFKPALRVFMQNKALEASSKFDPKFGASPTTWVHSNLRGAQRVNIKQQNVAKMSEENTRNIGRINRAAETLRDQFGRDPTENELITQLNLGMPQRKRLTPQKVRTIKMQAGRADIPASGFESDPLAMAAQSDQEIVSLLPQRFSQQGKADHLKVLDKIYGDDVTSTGAIAKQLGWSSSKVSRIKKDIENEYRAARQQPLRAGRKKT